MQGGHTRNKGSFAGPDFQAQLPALELVPPVALEPVQAVQIDVLVAHLRQGVVNPGFLRRRIKNHPFNPLLAVPFPGPGRFRRPKLVFFRYRYSVTRLTSSMPASLEILPPAAFHAAIKASLSYFQDFSRVLFPGSLMFSASMVLPAVWKKACSMTPWSCLILPGQLHSVSRCRACGVSRLGGILCCADISARMWLANTSMSLTRSRRGGMRMTVSMTYS